MKFSDVVPILIGYHHLPQFLKPKVSLVKNTSEEVSAMTAKLIQAALITLCLQLMVIFNATRPAQNTEPASQFSEASELLTALAEVLRPDAN
jgi:hypothetical protein